MEKEKELKNRYQEAMSELHYVPAVKLLEQLSAALSDNNTRLAILQPFHALCFNLLKQLGTGHYLSPGGGGGGSEYLGGDHMVF